MPNPAISDSRNRRARMLCGLALFALAAGLVFEPDSASAQAFQASPISISGAAGVSTSPGRTDITVDSSQVIIDWEPFDVSTTTDPLRFQDVGTVAQFANGTSSPGMDYTVLNRIVPIDETGLPQNRPIEFFGLVESLIDNARGGNIWFWSPTGIIVGSGAQFNVGSLLLTTNDIDTTGGLYGSAGEIRFRGPVGSPGSVQVQFGAQINALGANNAYVGLVAPSVFQGGTVQSNGAIAYVAAEQADITFNAGMVDILVTQGTEDATGITHASFGTSGGPQSTGSADVQQLAMVAVPKNSALTMLLSGTIGYVPAASAANEGSAVVLSAGQGLGFDNVAGTSVPGSITIERALFTSPLAASATDVIDVNPDFFSTVEFQSFADLYGANAVNISALEGSQVTGVSLTARSAENVAGGNGGSINLFAGPGGIEGGPGVIDFSGALTLDASSRNEVGDTNPDNIGGDITIASLGGTIDLGVLDANASANGSDSAGIGGNGTGGSLSLLASGGGSISVAGPISLGANGIGGSGATGGGSGIGGTIDIGLFTGGSINATGLASLSAFGQGGNSGGPGGDAGGGTIALTVDGADFSVDQLFLDASGFGGGGSSFGTGLGGTNGLDLSTASGPGSFSVTNDLFAFASGDSPSAGTGFSANLDGMDAIIGGSAFISTSRDASFGFASGAAFASDGAIDIGAVNILAGTATLTDGQLVAGGALSLFADDTLFVDAPAYGATVSATSSDIEIGSLGSLGLRGVTSSLDLFNLDTTRNMVIGGAGQAGAYSLSANEATRIFADQFITFVQSSDGVAANVLIDDLVMNFGPGGNIGAGGSIAVFADGRVGIIGHALFNTVSPDDVISINAATLDIVTDRGSLALRDASGAGLGIADLFADRIAVATSDALGQLGGGGLSTSAITALLDVPQASSGPDGFLQAGTITVNVNDGFYVQNSGASILFADRRGFSATSLDITTGSPDAIISINGVTIDGSGSRIAGLDTAATILINGLPAIAPGLFDPFSTINGCIIGATCLFVPPPEKPPSKPTIKAQVEQIGPSLDNPPPIQTAEFTEDRLLPLVDEPVTGVGNDDLWQSGCSPDSDDCDRGGY